jgi:hypothetical protein
MGFAPEIRRAVFERFLVFVTVSALSVALVVHGAPRASAEPVATAGAGVTTSPAWVGTDPTGVEDRIVRFASTINTDSGFVHPGIGIDLAQSEFVKSQLAAGAEPWTGAFQRATRSSYASLTYTPHPAERLDRSTVGSNGRTGGVNLNQDGVAVITQAIAYYYEPAASSRKNVYAQNTIKILNAWSRTLKSVDVSAQLDAAWASEVFPRAAEIVRYSYVPSAGQAALDVSALSSVLTNLFLPQLDENSAGAVRSGGNWALSMPTAR